MKSVRRLLRKRRSDAWFGRYQAMRRMAKLRRDDQTLMWHRPSNRMWLVPNVRGAAMIWLS
jgi:hypothetical protein